MVYIYDFTPEKYCFLISENIENTGKKGLERDIDLICYFLVQKYSWFDIIKLSKRLLKKAKQALIYKKYRPIFEKLCSLADDDRYSTKFR